jgi:hypothetical protein
MDEKLFEMRDAEFDTLNAEAQGALGLLDSETADAIIGEPGEEYGELIRGARSAMTMLWMLMKSFGVKESPKSLKGFSQAMVVVLTLVHYAYALGVRRGQE